MPIVQSGLISEDREMRYIADPTITPIPTALYTDLYHVDAAFVAWKSGQMGEATFDLYTRSNPFGGGFMLVAGLEPALDYLRAFRYRREDRDYLERIKGYEPDFLEYLRTLRFTGQIQAIPEGEIAFPNESLLRITAPFPEALIIESGLLRSVGISTLIATKAARLSLAAKGRTVADFAFRRAHEPFLAARSGYIGGCASTSFVAGAREYDIPGSGTIPHALVQAYADELAAFRAVAAALPEFSLLLDTYDVAQGIENTITAGKEAREVHGHRLNAVRLDSGDLDADSRLCRSRLDEAGMRDVRILVSGDIDEYKIERFVRAGAPIDGYGVGGNLGVGLGTVESGTVGGVIGAVYKLAWYGGDRDEGASARIKLAGGGDKSTWPGRKTAYRIGDFERDVIELEGGAAPDNSRPLLHPVIERGHLVADVPSIKEARSRALQSLADLPERLRNLTVTEPYEIQMSDAVQRLRDETIASLITINNSAR